MKRGILSLYLFFNLFGVCPIVTIYAVAMLRSDCTGINTGTSSMGDLCLFSPKTTRDGPQMRLRVLN